MFVSAADGTLQAAGSVQTGGRGTGAGIENQGALSVTGGREVPPCGEPCQ